MDVFLKKYACFVDFFGNNTVAWIISGFYFWEAWGWAKRGCLYEMSAYDNWICNAIVTFGK